MDPWDHIRRAVADRRSGSVDVTVRAARGLAGLRGRSDVMRASRALLRAHPCMGALRRACALAYAGGDVAQFAEALESETAAASDAARWIVTKRSTIVLTHSSSSSVLAALRRVQSRVESVLCTASLPGGEGRRLARALVADGFDAEVVPDSAIAGAAARADVALVGADALTPEAVVNKVGTTLVALAARETGIGCYAFAASSKLVPSVPDDDLYDQTPLGLFDAVVTERGPQRPAQIRRAAARITIPPAIRST